MDGRQPVRVLDEANLVLLSFCKWREGTLKTFI